MAKVLLYELGKSISFGRLPLLGKVLWPMLLAASDNQGRGLAEPDVIKWTICANVNELTPENIPEQLGHLAAQGMIHLYTDSRDRQLYQVLRWWEYQQLQWAQPSEYEPPAGWIDRVRYQRGDVQTMQNWDKVGGFLDNGGGKTRPGAKDTAAANPGGNPAGEPAATPPGEPPAVLKQSKAKQTNGNQGNSNQSKSTQPKGETPTKSQILPADDAFPDALALLHAVPMTEPNASKVAAAGVDWVQGWLEEFERRAKNGRAVNNPAGLLYSMFESGTSPPARASPDDGRRKHRRSLDGEYADYIQH